MLNKELQSTQWLQCVVTALGDRDYEILERSQPSVPPVRPSYPEQAVKPEAWVFLSEDDSAPVGVLYRSEDGSKLVYTPAKNDRLEIEKAEYLETPPNVFTSRIIQGVVTYGHLGEWGVHANTNDKKWLLACYHGKERAAALIATLALD